MDASVHQLAGNSQGYRGKVLVLVPGSHVPCIELRPSSGRRIHRYDKGQQLVMSAST